MRVSRLLVSTCVAACAASTAGAVLARDRDDNDRNGSGAFRFTPLPTSAVCGPPGGNGAFPNERPFVLPPGFSQQVIAREGDGGAPDNFDMNTLNETGRQAGRFLYRTHETVGEPSAAEPSAVSVTDLRTGITRVLAQPVQWNRVDGIVWTPWRTLLIGEEMRPGRVPSTPEPTVPQAQAGLIYEVDPVTGASVASRRSARRRTKAFASTRAATSTASRKPGQRRWSTERRVPAGTSSSSHRIGRAISRVVSCTR